ncbi:MAG: hypothetical protein LBU86_02185 [Oscillospiraceae bacterium]|jgi:hypothetical protein|nr:hypothetical protein [Oscillospiraceae bacterium]
MSADAVAANPRYITQQSYGSPTTAYSYTTEQFSDDTDLMGEGFVSNSPMALSLSGFDSLMPVESTSGSGADIRSFLSSHLGDMVRVEFLLADNTIERVGILSEVGDNYIVLNSADNANRLLCDMSSIKFVTITQNDYSQNSYSQNAANTLSSAQSADPCGRYGTD